MTETHTTADIQQEKVFWVYAGRCLKLLTIFTVLRSRPPRSHARRRRTLRKSGTQIRKNPINMVNEKSPTTL